MDQRLPSGISVIIPARNEEERISATVEAAKGLPHVKEVLVVDDGSTDETARLANEAGARVIVLRKNVGKAAAVMQGYALAGFRWVLLLDADLAATATEADCLISPIVSGQADMTIARFPEVPGRGGGAGIVVRLARWGAYRLGGVKLRAPLSGQRCLEREAMEAALPFSGRFGLETSLNVAVARAGFRILEVETSMDHRVTHNDWRGRIHRARQCIDVVAALIRSVHFPWKP